MNDLVIGRPGAHPAAPPNVVARRRTGAFRGLRREETLTGYLFLLPNLIGFLIFSLIPIVATFGLTFTDWNLIGERAFVGLDNYAKLLSDQLFWQTLRNTVTYTLGAVPAGVFIAFWLALLLNRKMRGEVTAEELASVIAHEMGHVALGHTRRRMIDFTGQNAVFVMLSALLNRFVPIVGVWIANTISTVLMAHLSRRDEFEADAYATALLIKAGIGSEAQKSLFRKLGALTKGHAEGVPAWMLSHPKADERIAAIEANERRWLAPRIGQEG